MALYINLKPNREFHKFMMMFENIIDSNGYFQQEFIVVDDIYDLNKLVKALCDNYHRLIPRQYQNVHFKILGVQYLFCVTPTMHGVRMTLISDTSITFVVYPSCSLEYTFGLLPSLPEIREIIDIQRNIAKLRQGPLSSLTLDIPVSGDINRSLYLTMNKFNDGVIPTTLKELYHVLQKAPDNNLSFNDRMLLHDVCLNYQYWYGQL